MKKIITFLLTVVFAVCLFACDGCNKNQTNDKKNPIVSNDGEVFAQVTENDFTYKVTKGELYLTLKKDVGTTLLTNLVDKYLLQNLVDKDYYTAVETADIVKAIDKDVYGEDGKEELDLEEQTEKEEEFLKTMFISYGVNATNIYDDGIKDYYRLTLAETDYAKAQLALEMADEENAEAYPDGDFVDSKYQTKYDADNYNSYKAIIVTFTTERLAAIALQAIGVEVKDGVWADSSTHNALSAAEVVNKYIDLYKYQYGFKEALTVDSEEFAYTASELSSYSATIATRIKDKMEAHTESSTNVNPDWYYATPYVTSGGSVYAYVCKLGETLVTEFKDLSETELESVKANYKDEIINDTVTSTYILTKMAKLREENGFKIYDAVLEIGYKSIASKYQAEFATTTDQSDDNVASLSNDKKFTADELFDEMVKAYGLSSIGDKFLEKRLLINTKFNPYFQNGEWVDTDVKKSLEGSIATEKSNFESGTYKDYGYDTTTCSWTTFIEASYGVNNDTDLLMYFLYDKLQKEFVSKINYIAANEKVDDVYTFYVNDEDVTTSHLWTTLLTKMDEKNDEYFSVKGVHFLVCVYENVMDYIGGKTGLDPEKWTEAQKTAATELITKVREFIIDSNGTYAEKFGKITKAFETSPNKSGSFTYNGNNINSNITSDGGLVTIDVAKYKELGLYVLYEDLGSDKDSSDGSSNKLEINNGDMVETFNDALKAIYDKDVADSNYTRETIVTEPIVTEYGYHLYINQNSYERTDLDSSDEVIRYLPTVEEIRTYVKNNTDSSLSVAKRKAITTYYTPYATELSGEYFTYALRFYQLQSFISTFTGSDSISSELLNKYVSYYIDYTFENNLSKIDKDFLENFFVENK